MDEEKSVETIPSVASQDRSRSPPTPTFGNGQDQEQESSSLVDEAQIDGSVKQRYERGDFGGRLMIRRTTLALMAFVLVAVTAVSGYYLLELYNSRRGGSSNQGSNGDSSRAPGVRPKDCPYTLEDIEGLQDEVTNLESQLPCEFSLDDVEALKEQVSNLEAANDQLAEQLLDYLDINLMLNSSIAELQVQNGILAENNEDYQALNQQLNASLQELQYQNEFLAEQVETFAQLNQDLNDTASDLEEQVDRLEGEVDNLANQNDRLEALVSQLNNETEDLSEVVDLLEGNVSRLEGKIQELGVENDRLEGLVDDLRTVADFLDETSENLDESYEQVASVLAGQIATSRLLVAESLQNTYHQRVSNWDCAFRDRFALEDFESDPSLPIPDDKMPAVMAYVEERVLSDLCLDANDFELYMNDRYSGGDITSSRLTSSVSRYTWGALDYYFPDADGDGLTPEDWASTGYECGNLSPEKRYSRM